MVLAFALVAAWLAWRSRAWSLVHDAPIMHYIAWRIGEGAVPYRDLFDMNFPGAYLLHLAVLRTLGPSDAAWRAFDLAWLGAGALAVAALARRWGTVAAAGGALLYVVHHLAGGAWQAGQRDFLLSPFLLLGALGVARWTEAAASRASLAGAGLALGAAITIKPQAAAFAALLAGLVAVEAWRGQRKPAATLAVFLAAVLVPPVAVGGWLAASGGLAAWREIVFEYLLPLYSRLGQPAHWAFYRWHVWIAIAAAVAISLGRALVAGRFTGRRAVAALGLAYGVLHFFGQGKGWEYHIDPLAAFAAVLAFSGFDPALDPPRARRAPGRLAPLALAASLAVVVIMLAVKGSEASRPRWLEDKERRVSALVSWLAPRTGPRDLVQVLDTAEGGAHVLLRLRAVEPTRFLYDFHFYHDVDRPLIQRLRAEFARGLEARPPRFIILFERGWPEGGYERVERFPALRDRLAAAYRVDARGDGWIVYAKRDDS